MSATKWLRGTLLSAAMLAGAAGLAHAADVGLDVRTAQGVVHGASVNGLNVFRSIPYAAPPVGALRFKSPQPPQAWTGVRAAIEDGPSCPQNASADPAGKASTNEDCLRLNVFAPPGGANAKRPVMVWIHGGGFNEGFGGAKQYNPTTIVKEGGIIAVTINYRVGAFGLLAIKSLDDAKELSGNYATRDQQAALRWVQKNIAAFGGDPKNVTIAGESAGGASVLALVASPLSKGRFQQAIAQSPPYDTHAAARATSEKKGEELAEKLGCKTGPDQATCLRALPVDALLKVRGELSLTEDPKLFPQDPYEAFRDGKFNRVPMIIGSNLHEAWFHTAGSEKNLGHAMTPADYVTLMKGRLGAGADEAMREYPAASRPLPAMAMGDAATDIQFSCPAELARAGAAKYAAVYGFEMNEPNPVQQQPRQVFSLTNTSYHTSDLAYLFDFVTTGPLEGEAATLGKKMRGYWLNLMKTGSPNGGDLPPWPQYSPTAPALLELSNAGGVTNDFALRHRCAELQKSGLVYAGLR